jgi:hypothetical protein
MSAQSNGSEPPRPLRVSEQTGYSPHGWKEEDSEVFVVQPTGELTPVPRDRVRREQPAADPLAGLRKQVRARAQERTEGQRPPTSLLVWVGGATAVSVLCLVIVAAWILS